MTSPHTSAVHLMPKAYPKSPHRSQTPLRHNQPASDSPSRSSAAASCSHPDRYSTPPCHLPASRSPPGHTGPRPASPCSPPDTAAPHPLPSSGYSHSTHSCPPTPAYSSHGYHNHPRSASNDSLTDYPPRTPPS